MEGLQAVNIHYDELIGDVECGIRKVAEENPKVERMRQARRGRESKGMDDHQRPEPNLMVLVGKSVNFPGAPRLSKRLVRAVPGVGEDSR